MSTYPNPEPIIRYVERVRVGRNFVQTHDVTIIYNNPGRGRGGFTVEGGNKIREELVDRNRRLTIEFHQNENKKQFQITRRQGGGYNLNTRGYWKIESERVYY